MNVPISIILLTIVTQFMRQDLLKANPEAGGLKNNLQKYLQLEFFFKANVVCCPKWREDRTQWEKEQFGAIDETIITGESFYKRYTAAMAQCIQALAPQKGRLGVRIPAATDLSHKNR